jgi:hypothetical protein
MFKKSIVGLVISALMAVASIHTRAATLDVNGLEVGGSNFVMYDVSMVPWNGSLWYQPMALRPVIGTLHYDPERVRAELTVMKSRGQKKVSLVLWHMHIDPTPNDVYGHVVASNGGALTSQHAANLSQVLGYIAQLGFQEVQLRFAPQGGNHPELWTAGWNESAYQENWNFLVNTRQIVEDALSQTRIRRTYDLGAEMAGLTNGQLAPYARRLWSDYTYSFGNDDTYGFSVATYPGRLTAFIQNMDLTGARPNSYAFDLYGDEYQQLQGVRNELAAAGDLEKSIIIQEDYYNDADSYQQIVQAKNELELNIRTIMQWPLQRGIPDVHFTMNYAKEYRNYNPHTVNGITGIIDASTAVCTIPSNSSVCSPTITWTTSPATVANINLGSGQLFAQGTSGAQSAPWIFPGHVSFLMTAQNALLDQVSVYGLPMKGKLASSSPTNTCQLQSGQNVCTLTIYWSVPDGWNETVSVKVGNQLFATSGITGTGDAPWITTQGATFSLYAGSMLLDELFVRAVSPCIGCSLEE